MPFLIIYVTFQNTVHVPFRREAESFEKSWFYIQQRQGILYFSKASTPILVLYQTCLLFYGCHWL